MSVHVGFTGTRHGMTEIQEIEVMSLLTQLHEEQQIEAGHHGDCVGADAQAHDIYMQLGIKQVIHPPSDPRLRAWCDTYRASVREAKDYLTRNRDIVDESDYVIAAPYSNRQTGGTWYTIRYAAAAGKLLAVIAPDGKRIEVPQ